MAERFKYSGPTIETSRRYRHIKRGHHYRALHEIALREADCVPLVVYQRVAVEIDDTVWVRPLTEFLERFEVVPLSDYANEDVSAPEPSDQTNKG